MRFYHLLILKHFIDQIINTFTSFFPTTPAVPADLYVLDHWNDYPQRIDWATSLLRNIICLISWLGGAPIPRVHCRRQTGCAPPFPALLLGFVAVFLFLERVYRQIRHFDTLSQFPRMGIVKSLWSHMLPGLISMSCFTSPWPPVPGCPDFKVVDHTFCILNV